MASIAVVGSGAVGSYYGALLSRAGHDVRFLMRRDLRAVREGGLRVESPLGGFTLAPVQAVARAADLGTPAWVLCALKTTALDEARPLLEACAGPETRIIAMMNGLGVEQRLAQWFPAERIFGAMAFVCLNRGDPGTVRHIAYGRVTIGHLLDDPAETAALEQLLRSGEIDAVTAPNLRYARWEKLGWNVPFSGWSVAGGGISTRTILDDPPLRQLASRAMDELVTLANADLAAAGSPDLLDGDELHQRLFALTETMGPYRTSMVLDYIAGRPLEVETILGEPVRRAAELGVPVPTLDALYVAVRTADRRVRGEVPSLTADE